MRLAILLSVALVASAVEAQLPDLAGCQVFPADNIWNAPVDSLPIDPLSSRYINEIGPSEPVHPDFGSGEYPAGSGAPIGIPWIHVPGTQPPVPVSFLYDDESDPGPYPIPSDAPIEGGPDGTGDRHILVVDRTRCMLYETFSTYPDGQGGWTADSGAIFDLRSNALRPAGWTSSDAAGLPLLPGLVRYEEVAAGEIRHALRFTAPRTRRDYVWPARHFASSLTDLRYPPMGQRFRLRANFDTSGFSPRNRVILQALKRYGMMLADNGSSWFLSGAPDERWDNDELRELRTIAGSDFEAVDVSSLMVNADSGATNNGPVGGDCEPSATTLCLNDGRFEVTLVWRDFNNQNGRGTALAVDSEDSGIFWFFQPDNWELMVKVLDACGVNRRFWVFSAASTNVEYTLRVEDMETGRVNRYENQLGVTAQAVTDTNAFARCP